MYVKTAKLVPFAVMGERFGIANDKSKVSDKSTHVSSRVTAHAPSRWEVKTGPCTSAIPPWTYLLLIT